MSSYLETVGYSGQFGKLVGEQSDYLMEQMNYPGGDLSVSVVAHLGHISVLRSLLKEGKDVSGCGMEERAPYALETAVAHGYNSMVEVLLENGAEVNAALPDAIFYNQVSTFRLLIGKFFDVSGPMWYGGTPLHAAVGYIGRVEIVKILLEIGADVLATDSKGLTPLDCVAPENDEVLEVILEKYPVSATNKYGETTLHIAISYGFEEIAKKFLENGADVSATNNEGETPLHIAASSPSEEIVTILLEKGADVSATDNKGKTPLHIAVSRGSKKMVRILLEKGADVSATDDQGQTPLHIAVSHGTWEMVRILLEKGADVSATDDQGQTPLYIAVSHGTWEMVRILLEKGP